MSEVAALYSKGAEPLEIGVIGAGGISTIHLPILLKNERTKLKFLADVDGKRAKLLSGTYDVRPIEIDNNVSELPDCQILLLAIPPGARREYIEEFGVDRGTPILSEKPFASSIEEHQEYLDKTRAMFCNYHRICHNSVNQVLKLLESGTFGNLERVEMYEGAIGGGTGISQRHYMTDSSLRGGGILMDRGSHNLSELLYVFRDWKLSVEESDITWNNGFDVDVHAKLAAAKGNNTVPIYLENSIVRNIGYGAVFSFESAKVSYNPDDPNVNVVVSFGDTCEYSLSFDQDFGTSKYQAMHLRWEQFISSLEGDSSDGYPKTGLEVTKLMNSIYGNAEEPSEVINT
jgi:predicted dehydrogenase